MSNVIKKVFNTDKAEAEGSKVADAPQEAGHKGEGFLHDAKDRLQGFAGHGHHNAQNAASGVAGSAGAGGAPSVPSANVDVTNPVNDASVQGGVEAPRSWSTQLPQSQSVADTTGATSAGRNNLTQTTSTGSGVNVAAGNVDQDVQHLAPVTRHVHHRHEIEELLREREHHIHQHHIQHHVQPVVDSEHLAEQIHSRVVPQTTVREVHANTDKDAALMRAVAGNPKDTFTQAAIDRSVIDKGETVREIVHHHIHNIVQPIIEKETHEYHRIRTTIPTTHITHEAPIVHESTAHQPIRKEDFLKGGGVLTSTTRSIEEAGLLNLGNNQRTVEGETYTGGLPLSQ
ncbi:allergen [Malassezia sympodialis ATCC 42132]|uniref:M. sympodialis allergen Mala s 9 n=1 Tax=Malassezia sympodialis (strain ATCC 42132) TaxID=1230383 RepID=M5ENF2_MALS4|nr:allergen [Malassezia sympodialis ATCC 42132]CCU99206.1 allergen [Malassezia sympodialis ATCC 42132]SHO78461.1 M. sympodialis allergen Mala s 9 [Malassezia sympodialis ATCC 42132]|eukprot:XP_018740468.1 allergen [Malassezia sympodialis ATCC 42132]